MVNGRFKVNIVQSIIHFQKRNCTYPQNALNKILGGGGAVAQWLRCCATNRKVAGWITAGVLGIFR